MAKQTILVTGSSGQLGSELNDIYSNYPQYDFWFLSRTEFSIDDIELARSVFEKYHPAYLINCAAYTAVDKAEVEKETADRINGYAVGDLAKLCKDFNTKFIHISTDYVFSGTASSPLKESDPVDPVNAYGYGKLLGEQLAFRNNPDSVVIRTSSVYSHHGKNFVKTMMRLMEEKESISVVSDQLGSPTYAADLAEAIMLLISSGKWSPGIYNYSNEGHISWHDFAIEIRDQTGSSCVVKAISTSGFPTPAKRPAYSVLDKTKIIETYGIEPKEWKESLKLCLAKIRISRI